MRQLPVAIGLLVCDQVIIQESTRNATPVNCFTTRKVERVPAEPFPFSVFAVLTDGSGDIPLEITINRLDNLDEIYRRSAIGRFTDPLREQYLILPVRICSFPEYGFYQVSLLADREPIAQKRMRIAPKEAQP